MKTTNFHITRDWFRFFEVEEFCLKQMSEKSAVSKLSIFPGAFPNSSGF